jgi:fumarylacetoacetase
MESAAQTSWLYKAEHETHFPLENIPFGVAVHPSSGMKVCCTRIGDKLICLRSLEEKGFFNGPHHAKLQKKVFAEETLNFFASHGKHLRIEVRETLQRLFSSSNEAQAAELEFAMFAVEGTKMCLPVFCRDYTDFYSSKNHAYNVGVIVRGHDNAL